MSVISVTYFILWLIGKNIMLVNQRQQCTESATAHLRNSQKRDSSSRMQKREIVKELSARRIKLIHTRSDNSQEHKTIQVKKMKSVNLIPKNQLPLQQPFDQYQMTTPTYYQKSQKQLTHRVKCKQVQRQDSSQSNYGEIVSQYRKSQSRFKNAKQKAKKLIQKMISNSNRTAEEIQNQFKNNIPLIQTQVPSQKTSSNLHYVTSQTQKLSSVSSASHFRPKLQKCSTLNFGYKQPSPLGVRLKSPLSTKERLSSFKCEVNLNSASKLRGSNNSIQQQQSFQRKTPSSQQSFQSKTPSSQKSTITMITADSGSNNTNPLTLQEKQLFSGYGITDFTLRVTKKQMISETGKDVKQFSRQISMSRKQTQKLITRARQKNKKIIGKLKEMREKRSSIRNSHCLSNDLPNSISKQSKIKIDEQTPRLNRKKSFLQSYVEQFHWSFNLDQSTDDFLGVSSNTPRCSKILFNEQLKEKILIHLETIKTIADYAQSFTNIYEDCNQWEDLIFLLYKKYYIERFKIYHILKTGKAKLKDGTLCKQSPFVFNFCPVSIQEIQSFRESKQEISLQLELESSNAKVKSTLRDFYNKFIEKTADNPYINMYETDDFSEQILEDLNEQISILIESGGKSPKIKKRINEAIQVGLMIEHLQGYTFQDIEEIVVGQLQSKSYFCKFYKKFIEIFQEENDT